MIEGKYVSQMREVTPVDGNFSFGSTRMHFGLGDAELIDSLIFRWPSGHVDTYLNVEANQFYRAIENEELGIDFKATNYIEYRPALPDTVFTLENESITFELNKYYRLITGDTIPIITGDTITFDSIINENPGTVTASINGSTLSLESGIENGESEIHVIADAGFTKRMDSFTISRIVGINNNATDFGLSVFPNPFSTSTTIEYTLTSPQTITLSFYNQFGKMVDRIQQKQSGGKQQVVWTPELPGGIYYFRLEAWEQIASGKVVLVR
jgi:hypothetical protein